MLISVVIPTYNRSDVLGSCLKALSLQDLPQEDFEFIVVDDGSDDDTFDVVNSYDGKILNLIYLKQKNQGQGVARNYGVMNASSDIVVFIGDDIIVNRDFLSEHLKFHLRYSDENVAVLGFVAWHPELKVNDVMKWLTNGSSLFGKFGGHQFAFEKLNGKDEADFNFFYTSNISLKKSLVVKFPFDPEFAGYGWEDIELGYRLYKRVGLRVLYNVNAVGYHYHYISFDDMKKRMESIGRSAWVIDHKYPELHKVPSFFKKIVFEILAFNIFLFKFICSVTQGHFCALYYYAVSKKYFLKGLKSKI